MCTNMQKLKSPSSEKQNTITPQSLVQSSKTRVAFMSYTIFYAQVDFQSIIATNYNHAKYNTHW